jgi:Zn-dependent protease with chaperone function
MRYTIGTFAATGSHMVVQKQRLPRLDHGEYEHPFDQKALQVLEATPGLDTLLEKVWKYGLENLLRVQYTGSYMKITPNNYGRIHRLFTEAAEILELDHSTIDFYMIGGQQINAHTTGVERPLVAIYSWLVDMMTEEEIQYVIAHELGHIKSRHVLYHQLASILLTVGQIVGNVTLGIGNLLATGIQIPLMHWYRMSEFTCDRAGLLVVQDIDVATSATMKMAGVPFTQKDQLNLDEWRSQSQEFQDYDYDTLKKISRLWTLYNPGSQMSHPFTVIRSAELEKWIRDGSYDRVLRRETAGAAPRAAAGGAACPHCGNQLPPNQRFCRACGTDCLGPVSQPVQSTFCAACGYPLQGFEGFCPRCGAVCVAGAQAQRRFCIACGHPLRDQEVFCPGCGRSVQA